MFNAVNEDVLPFGFETKVDEKRVVITNAIAQNRNDIVKIPGYEKMKVKTTTYR